jgi:hypothetical protein
MSVRKRIGKVCLICGGLLAAGDHVQHECPPMADRVEVCAPSLAVLPDARHPGKAPGPIAGVLRVVRSVSSWIGAQDLRWGDKSTQQETQLPFSGLLRARSSAMSWRRSLCAEGHVS